MATIEELRQVVRKILWQEVQNVFDEQMRRIVKQELDSRLPNSNPNSSIVYPGGRLPDDITQPAENYAAGAGIYKFHIPAEQTTGDRVTMNPEDYQWEVTQRTGKAMKFVSKQLAREYAAKVGGQVWDIRNITPEATKKNDPNDCPWEEAPWEVIHGGGLANRFLHEAKAREFAKHVKGKLYNRRNKSGIWDEDFSIQSPSANESVASQEFTTNFDLPKEVGKLEVKDTLEEKPVRNPFEKQPPLE